MTDPDGPWGIALPVFDAFGPGEARHPVLAAVLAEMRERKQAQEPPAAYYGDSPDPAQPGPPAGAGP
jgi:hypothetical protein